MSSFNWSQVPYQIVLALFQGSIYALFALGYTLIFGVLDLLNMAHASIFMAAALVSYALLAQATLPLNVYLAFILAVIIAGFIGVLLDFIAFRPLRGRGGHLSPFISSIAVATIFEAVAQGRTNAESKNFPEGTLPGASHFWQSGQVSIYYTDTQILIVLVSLVLMGALTYLVRRTNFGRSLRAVAENPRSAALLGINVNRLISQTFFLASALGGAAGILYALNYNRARYEMGHDVELKGLAIIVLGGMGSIPGAVAAAFILALVEAFTVVVWGTDYRDLAAFVILFVILVIRPSGLLGRHAVKAG